MSPRYIGPFEVLECVVKVAYRLTLPPKLSGVHNVFHVSMLKEYHQGPTPHVIDFRDIEVNDMSYTERPVQILVRETNKLRNKEISLVKVQWNHHDVRKASYELESMMYAKYPKLFAMT